MPGTHPAEARKRPGIVFETGPKKLHELVTRPRSGCTARGLAAGHWPPLFVLASSIWLSKGPSVDDLMTRVKLRRSASQLAGQVSRIRPRLWSASLSAQQVQGKRRSPSHRARRQSTPTRRPRCAAIRSTWERCWKPSSSAWRPWSAPADPAGVAGCEPLSPAPASRELSARCVLRTPRELHWSCGLCRR